MSVRFEMMVKFPQVAISGLSVSEKLCFWKLSKLSEVFDITEEYSGDVMYFFGMDTKNPLLSEELNNKLGFRDFYENPTIHNADFYRKSAITIFENMKNSEDYKVFIHKNSLGSRKFSQEGELQRFEQKILDILLEVW